MDGAKHMNCPSCARQLESAELACPHCGGPTGADLDCFAALGLAPALLIDGSALERAYHDLTRRMHPDRFVRRDPAIRDASLRATALLTRSYRTLRDPVARGTYWLMRRGVKIDDNNRGVPVDLADLVFEVQDQLAELRGAQRGSTAWCALADTTALRRHEIAAQEHAAAADLEANFRRWDANDGDSAALTDELKTVLARIAYLRTLGRDVDRELESVEAA